MKWIKFSCNKNYRNKNPIKKYKENYNKILNLLLIENINHYIMTKNLHCFLTNRCSEKDNLICRTCLNIFYSENKYNDHINYCNTRKPQRLLPANEKYITFNKLQNCMLNDFFPGPQAFCKKAVERVRSEKNILNSSVEWSGWSSFF